MKKKCLILLCLTLILLSMAFPALAAGSVPRLVDDADYLTASEERELLSQLNEISDRQDVDIVIVTVPSLQGEDITAYADDFYDYNGFRGDGVLLLIADFEREWAISTTGFGITALTDAGQDYMADQFVPLLSAESYEWAFRTFVELCDEFITQAKNGRPYDVGSMPKGQFPLIRNLVISFGIGFLIALVVTAVMRAQLKSVRAQDAASEYVRAGSMNITHARDIYLYRQTHRQRRETSKSGGSSTHRSSSGRSHGGSKGSF